MNHFPVYLDLSARRVVLCGNGEMALAKLRLLARTSARMELFASEPEPELAQEAAARACVLHRRLPETTDLVGAALVYTAQGGEGDAVVARLARAAGVLVNVVDNLEASDFITPAIVDRAPVSVAIGTEGAAPVLARAIKADLEARLPAGVGRARPRRQGISPRRRGPASGASPA